MKNNDTKASSSFTKSFIDNKMEQMHQDNTGTRPPRQPRAFFRHLSSSTMEGINFQVRFILIKKIRLLENPQL